MPPPKTDRFIPEGDDPASYPKVLKCRGGWFAVNVQGEVGSGPWKNERAAEHALAGDMQAAWAAHNNKGCTCQ